MGSALIKGVLYSDVEFVDTPEGAMEVRYDEKRYDRGKNTILYFYHGFLVATQYWEPY